MSLPSSCVIMFKRIAHSDSKMPTVNYIIATCNTRSRRNHQEVSEYVLAIQLYHVKCLFKQKKKLGLPNYITQITIVEPPAKNEHYKWYYDKSIRDIEGVPIVYLPYVGKNEHHSYDQYLQAMLIYHPNFDYHLLIEDDYCISLTNPRFDLELVQHYQTKLPGKVGYLCTKFEEGDGYWYNSISNGMISAETVQHLVNFTKNNVVQFFYTVRGPMTQWRFGLPQFMFTELMHRCGVPHADILHEYNTMFYQTNENLLVPHSQGIGRECFVPVQLINLNIPYTSLYTVEELWKMVASTKVS